MRASRFLLTLATIVVLAMPTGCNQPQPPTPANAAATAPAPQAKAAPPTLTQAEQARVSARYECGPHQVVVLDRGEARIALNNGTNVNAGVIAGSTPATFTANGLTLVETVPGKAELSDDSGETQACVSPQAGDTPTGAASG